MEIHEFHRMQMDRINEIIREQEKGKDECPYCQDSGRCEIAIAPDDSYEDYCDCPAGQDLREDREID